MKKLFLPLFLCFMAVNAFAMTAEQVLRKSEAKDLAGNLNFQSYEVEYEVVPGVGKGEYKNSGIVVTMKETVDGTNRRMESKSVASGVNGYGYYSLIITEAATYVSAKYVFPEGDAIVFADYKVVNDTSSITTYDNNAAKNNIYDALDISFDLAAQAKNAKEYAINTSVKNAKQVREEIDNKSKEERTPEDLALAILSFFDTKFFIDRSSLLLNMSKIKFSEEAIYDGISESDEYKDASEEERRKLAKEKANDAEAFAEVICSEYRKVEGTNLYYPSEMIMKSPLFLEYYDDGVYYTIKTKYFKVLKPGEIDPSTFIPSNVKKGKGKVPKEFSQSANIYSGLMEQMKKELMKSIKESIKEGIKEAGKEAVKESAKSVTKGLLKGLGGF